MCGLGPSRCPWSGNIHAAGALSWKFDGQLAKCRCNTCDVGCELRFDEERKRAEWPRVDGGGGQTPTNVADAHAGPASRRSFLVD